MKTTAPLESKDKTRFRPTSGQAWFGFTILFIINVLNYADRYVLPAVLPKIQADLGLTPLQEGLLGSSFLFVYAIATLPLGVWADRSVRKNIVALCVGIWSVATVLAGFTVNFLQLFSVRSVLGIGEAGYAPASLRCLATFFLKRNAVVSCLTGRQELYSELLSALPLAAWLLTRLAGGTHSFLLVFPG